MTAVDVALFSMQEDDIKNAMTMYLDFVLKCNYGNTFEGIIAFNVALEQLKRSLNLP